MVHPANHKFLGYVYHDEAINLDIRTMIELIQRLEIEEQRVIKTIYFCAGYNLHYFHTDKEILNIEKRALQKIKKLCMEPILYPAGEHLIKQKIRAKKAKAKKKEKQEEVKTQIRERRAMEHAWEIMREEEKPQKTHESDRVHPGTCKYRMNSFCMAGPKFKKCTIDACKKIIKSD